MSKRRMMDVLEALEAAGWRLEASPGHRDKSIYRLVDDHTTWRLAGRDGERLTLTFWAFGDLGQRTDKLTDIFYCEERKTGARLYFDKRGTVDWENGLRRFLDGL